MQLPGAAEKALELMCERLLNRTAFRKQLAEHSVWEQRVAEAQTALPDQAGPLNSQLLLHRALALMRETAPGYLRHFMAQAEALMWLEQALEPPAAPPKATPRGKPNKTPSRGPRDGKSPR